MTPTRTTSSRSVAVVGGGASGLATALRLTRAGHDVEVIESDNVLGGRFGIDKLGDRSIMMGGKNIGKRYEFFREFTSAYGNSRYEPFGINASRVKDGQVLTLDSTRRTRSLRALFKAGGIRDLLRLGSLAAKVGLDREAGFLGAKSFMTLSAARDGKPLSAHFGPGLVRNLLRPMTIRMNGAEPDEVFLGTFGTNLALLFDTYDQLSDGIQPALTAFEQRVPVRRNTRVTDLVMENGVVTGLQIEENGTTDVLHYDGVVLAVPAHAAAKVTESSRPDLSALLAKPRYFPSTVVVAEYDRPMFTREVRALAFDDGPCSNAGSYGKNERNIVRYTFSGRAGRVHDVTQEKLDEWISATEDELIKHLGVQRGKRLRTAVRHWNAAYCAYLPFHGDFLSELKTCVADVEGLELAGDYLWGVSIEACSRSGAAAAEKMSTWLEADTRVVR